MLCFRYSRINKHQKEYIPAASGKAVCSSIEGKKTMKSRKAKLWKREGQKERQRTQTHKKWEKKSQNGPITVATTTDALANSPLLPALQ